MKILFIHQNMPGQFKHLAIRFGQDPANQVVFITKREGTDIPGVRRINYKPGREPTKGIHHYLIRTEDAVLHGQAVARAMWHLRQEGFIPDIVVAHPGWGESLFVKDVYPQTPLLHHCEFYYRGQGADIGFDPEFPSDLDGLLRSRVRNSHFLMALEACDRGWSPTQWQKSVHPKDFHHKISVMHEGVNATQLKPDPAATFRLPDGRVLSRDDEVVTYIARNLEPYRGFHQFMRAVPLICAARPKATILIVGGDEVSYGSPPAGFPHWRAKMLAEVDIDPARVIFLGRIPYDQFVRFLQVSSVHVYLTYPFVLSWSTLEAMAVGATVVASRTRPVEEVITHGQNGLLFDFFSPAALAAQVDEVLREPAAFTALGESARRAILRKYDLALCMKQQIAMINDVARRRG